MRRLRPALGHTATVLGTAMAKHIHTSTLTRIESVLGPTSTSLARRKARLVHVTPDPSLDPGPSPFPVVHDVDVRDGEVVRVVAHAGVFALGRLDLGTRLLLANLPAITPGSSVVDLGCGDGIVGLTVGGRHPDVEVIFTDESYMAVASARAGWAHAHGDRPARFLVADAMAGIADESVDVVLVNPPFHEDQVVGDAIAWEMFTGARRALRPGGRIVVVGNRHLAHHASSPASSEAAGPARATRASWCSRPTADPRPGRSGAPAGGRAGPRAGGRDRGPNRAWTRKAPIGGPGDRASPRGPPRRAAGRGGGAALEELVAGSSPHA